MENLFCAMHHAKKRKQTINKARHWLAIIDYPWQKQLAVHQRYVLPLAEMKVVAVTGLSLIIL